MIIVVVAFVIIVGNSIGLYKVGRQAGRAGGRSGGDGKRQNTLFTQLAAHAQSTQKFSAAVIVAGAAAAAVAYVLFS